MNIFNKRTFNEVLRPDLQRVGQGAWIDLDLKQKAKDNTVTLYVNGQRMTPGDDHDYNLQADQRTIRFFNLPSGKGVSTAAVMSDSYVVDYTPR